MNASTCCSSSPKCCSTSCRRFYEEIEVALEQVYGPEAREREVPEILRFGSWVGGDMDGNPDVHAKTLRETVARQQQIIVNRYFLECKSLAESLSQSASRDRHRAGAVGPHRAVFHPVARGRQPVAGAA